MSRNIRGSGPSAPGVDRALQPAGPAQRSEDAVTGRVLCRMDRQKHKTTCPNLTGAVQALRIYFSTIRSLFKKEWKDPHTYIVATNRGVSAFLKLLRSILRAEKDQLSHDVVLKYLEPLKSGWKTWETDKLSEKYVGSQGWKQLHRDMVEAIQKKFPAVK